MICFVMSGGLMGFLLLRDGNGNGDNGDNKSEKKGKTGDSIDVASHAGGDDSHDSDDVGKHKSSDENLRCQRVGIELLLESCPDDERKQSLKDLLNSTVS
mmetsp:Transcript_11564/g.27674  ORF Transcript_11564/g.27674 Transcript_11564/m.27674 type:complete len:100 (-) Transcript_11564:202-501(-)